jgi:hypothetical protein
MADSPTALTNSHQRVERADEMLRRSEATIGRSKETIKLSKEVVRVSAEVEGDRQRRRRKKQTTHGDGQVLSGSVRFCPTKLPRA